MLELSARILLLTLTVGVISFLLTLLSYGVILVWREIRKLLKD